MPFIAQENTLHHLADARAGDRFWYGLAYGGRFGETALLLTDQQHDPNATALIQQVGEMHTLLADSRMLVSGVACVEPTGLFRFNGQASALDFLETLHRCVTFNVEKHPALRRLIGARYEQLTAHGLVANTCHNDEMWEHLLPAGVPLLVEGQLGTTAAVLRRVAINQTVLFWMAPDAVDGHTLLVLAENNTADDATRFRDTLLRIQGDIGLTPQAAGGLMTRNEDGGFIIQSMSPQDLLTPLAALVSAHQDRYPTLRRLVNVQRSTTDASTASSSQAPADDLFASAMDALNVSFSSDEDPTDDNPWADLF